MQHKQSIESRISETLDSLNGIERATPGDHFYTRLIGKLQPLEFGLWEKVTSFVTRPLVAFSVFIVVLLSNGFVLLNNSGKQASAITDINDRTITEEYNQDFVAF